MNNLKQYNVKELDTTNLLKIKGGSLAYDIGWAIHWSFRSIGGNIPAMIEAAGVYGAHYAK